MGREGEESEESEGGGGADIVCVVGYPRISRDIPEFKILGYPRIFWDSLVLPSLVWLVTDCELPNVYFVIEVQRADA